MTGGIPGEDRLPLSDMLVHYAGQHLAVVVAETLEQAAGARPRWWRYATGPSHRSSTRRPGGRGGRAGAVLRRAPPDPARRRGRRDGGAGLAVVRQTYTTPVETHNPMEPRATVAVWEGDRLTRLRRHAVRHGHAGRSLADGVRRAARQRAGHLPVRRRRVRVQGIPVAAHDPRGRGRQGAPAGRSSCADAAARCSPPAATARRPSQAMTLAAAKDGKLAAIRHDTTSCTARRSASTSRRAALATSRLLYACPNVDDRRTRSARSTSPPPRRCAPRRVPRHVRPGVGDGRAGRTR